jgi:hypothetical protein
LPLADAAAQIVSLIESGLIEQRSGTQLKPGGAQLGLQPGS